MASRTVTAVSLHISQSIRCSKGAVARRPYLLRTLKRRHKEI